MTERILNFRQSDGSLHQVKVEHLKSLTEILEFGKTLTSELKIDYKGKWKPPSNEGGFSKLKGCKLISVTDKNNNIYWKFSEAPRPNSSFINVWDGKRNERYKSEPSRLSQPVISNDVAKLLERKQERKIITTKPVSSEIPTGHKLAIDLAAEKLKDLPSALKKSEELKKEKKDGEPRPKQNVGSMIFVSPMNGGDTPQKLINDERDLSLNLKTEENLSVEINPIEDARRKLKEIEQKLEQLNELPSSSTVKTKDPKKVKKYIVRFVHKSDIKLDEVENESYHKVVDFYKIKIGNGLIEAIIDVRLGNRVVYSNKELKTQLIENGLIKQK